MNKRDYQKAITLTEAVAEAEALLKWKPGGTGGQRGDKMENNNKWEIEGYLYNSASGYLVIVNNQGESIEIDDTLMRSKFLGRQVRLTVEFIPKVGI